MPAIELSPSHIDVSEYTPAQAECRASSASPVNYTWTRLNGDLSQDTWVQQGLLRFNGVRRSDIGEYRCVARNQFGEDSRILHVYVRNDQPRPPRPNNELVIQPSAFSGRTGDEVVLVCQDRTNPNAAVRWQKESRPGSIYNAIINNGEFIIPRAAIDDSGRYVCTRADDPSVSQSVDVHISSANGDGRPDPPKIKKFNDLYNVIQGSDFALACEVSGHPAPLVKWTKVHEAIDNNIQNTGNILRIMNAQPSNRGVYSCIAESDGGVAEESTVIDIERKLTVLNQMMLLNLTEYNLFTNAGHSFKTRSW